MEKIKVVVRTRPFNKREIELRTAQAVSIVENQVILTNNGKGSKSSKTFTFDRCFDSTQPDNPNYASQQTVYDGLGVDALDNIFSGYNACIFAYGQTGSGKSYSIMGSDANKGLLPRLCEDMFKRIEQQTSDELSFKVEVAYMEIYNEKLRDLLDPSGIKHNLKVREHQLLGIYVDGLSQLAVASYKDIEAIISEGNKSRTVAATNMNAESSRSHAVFCVKVSQNMLDKQTNISGEKVSKLSIVDLAGSEKVSKTGVEGDRLKEGCNINRSLHTLGQVISALADNASLKSGTTKQKHIPYRDSVLTWLLKDSLGGNSKTVMISTVSPASDNYEETLSTLRYSDRAKRIVNNAVVNEDPNAKIIRNLREEVEALKRELERAKEKMKADDLKDRLIESEKLYNEFSKPWTEKLAETEKIQREWSDTLQGMGISVQSSGIKVEKDKYYLVNMNADPSLNELLVYYLKDLTLVGRADAKNKQDIQLMGPGVAAEHCAFYLKNEHICVTPIKQAKTWVNGNLISGETLLNNGDRIALGINHFFRLNCPAGYPNPTSGSQSSSSSTPGSPSRSPGRRGLASSSDFKAAQEEVLLPQQQQQQSASEDGEEADAKSAGSSLSPTNSIDENGVALEYAIKRLEDEYSCRRTRTGGVTTTSTRLPHSASSSSLAVVTDKDLYFRKGLDMLREQLLRANTLAREANSICKEIGKPFRFGVTLQIPAHNLTPARRNNAALLSEAAIVVKNRSPEQTRPLTTTTTTNDEQFLIDLEKFETYIVLLREAYSELFAIQPVAEQTGLSAYKSSLIESMFDYESYNNLVGVANVFLDGLVHLAEQADLSALDEANPASPLKYEYAVPIVNQQGEIAGRLLVRLELQVLPAAAADEVAKTASPPSRTSDDSDASAENEDDIDAHTSIYEQQRSQETGGGGSLLVMSHSTSSFSLRRPRVMRFRLAIVEAHDLPAGVVHNVFCHYQFWNKGRATIMPQSVEKLASKKFLDAINFMDRSTGGGGGGAVTNVSRSKVRFNHEVEFLIDVNEEFSEYLQDCGGSLAIELFSNKYVSPLSDAAVSPPPVQSPAPRKTTTAAAVAPTVGVDESRLVVDVELLKQQSLIDSWNEVSKSFELSVKILELNGDQQWQPVEVRNADTSLTGGVYQLRALSRQRQPRQLLVTVSPTSARSVMWFNGLQFKLEPHRIDRVSVGCVVLTNPHRQLLDSYQENDLNRLRERCKKMIESRKQYLRSQLALLPADIDPSDEDARERYESLCQQLSDLNQEQVAIDAPENNSRLPGSTIEWQPAPGMEQHVPVVFLDLPESGAAESTAGGASEEDSDYDEEEPDDDERYRKSQDRELGGQVLGAAATLAEEADNKYIDFEIVNWNDSSKMEVKHGEQNFAYHPSVFADVDFNRHGGHTLKAVAAWDSSAHKSILLDAPTPLDTHIYLIVKLNLKFKRPLEENAGRHERRRGRGRGKSAKYVNVTLRKRICVNVGSSSATPGIKAAAAGINSLKKFISPSLNRQAPGSLVQAQSGKHSTGVTYRLISNIPRTLGEIESRKSLALKAASSVVAANPAASHDGIVGEREASGSTRPQYTISHFEFYAKTIEAVDSILKQDREQQRLAIRKELGGGKLAGGHEVFEAGSRMSRSSANIYKSPLSGGHSIQNLKSLSSYSTPYEAEEQYSSLAEFNMDIQAARDEAKSMLNSLIDKHANTFINVLSTTASAMASTFQPPFIQQQQQQQQQYVSATPKAPPADENKAPIVEKAPSPPNEKAAYSPAKISKANTSVIGTESEYSKAIPAAAGAASKHAVERSKQGISELIQILADGKSSAEALKPPPQSSSLSLTGGSSSNFGGSAEPSTMDTNIDDLIQDILKSDFKESAASEAGVNDPSRLSIVNKTLEHVQSSQSLSNQSITSGTASQHRLGSSGKLSENEPVPDWVQEGVHVIVSTNSVLNKRGHVRYIGPTKFGHGVWVGVELEELAGKNDGSVKNVRYFTCPENKGVFVRADKLTPVRSSD